jgi:hypothetical protein
MLRGSFGAGVLALVAVSLPNMIIDASPEQKLFGCFSYLAVGDGFVLLLSVFVGVVVAGSLAADRRRKYPILVLTRGISRERYLFTKAVAMAFAAGFGTFLACVLTLLVAALFLPWGSMSKPEYADSRSMGPYPSLLENYPLLNDIVLIVLLSLGAGALALSGLVFGTFVANEFVASAVPFVLLVAGIFVFRTDELLFLGPYTQLDLITSYPYSLPRWAWSFAAPLYWILFAFICVVTSLAVLLRTEDI